VAHRVGLSQRHASFEDYVEELAHSAPEGYPVHLLVLRENRPVSAATLKNPRRTL
jgi:hypothetical protein